jgi:hypothetical protein
MCAGNFDMDINAIQKWSGDPFLIFDNDLGTRHQLMNNLIQIPSSCAWILDAPTK